MTGGYRRVPAGEDGSPVVEREAWLRLLFIYFDEGHYDGYLWLSTFPEDLSESLADHSAP